VWPGPYFPCGLLLVPRFAGADEIAEIDFHPAAGGADRFLAIITVKGKKDFLN